MGTKFSNWVGGIIPDAPDNQIQPTDKLVVIRGGLPLAAPLNPRYAYGSMADNAVITTINTQDVWESFGGAIVPSGADEGFSWGGNILTHTDPSAQQPLNVFVDFTITRAGSPMADSIQTGIFKNGIIDGIGSTMTIENGEFGSAALSVPIPFNNGDTIEVMFRNRTDTNDITITDLQITVR